MKVYRIRLNGEGWVIHIISKTEPTIIFNNLGKPRGIDWTPIEDKTVGDTILALNWDGIIAVSYREDYLTQERWEDSIIKSKDGKQYVPLEVVKRLLK